MNLPALQIQIEGRIVASNLAEFRAAITEALQRVNSAPETDEEFGQASQDVRDLKAAEQALDAVALSALDQAADIRAALDSLDEARDDVRAARLELERRIRAERERRANGIVAEALGLIPEGSDRYRERLREAIKGTRTLETAWVAAKREAEKIAAALQRSMALVAAACAEHGKSLLPDADELIHRPPGEIEIEIARRIERRTSEAAIQAAQTTPKTEAAPETPAVAPAAPSSYEPTADEEWELFVGALKAALGEIRPIREGMKHKVNIDAAALLASQIAAALKQIGDWRK